MFFFASLFFALRISNPFSASLPCSSVSFFSVESLYLQTLISSPFRLLAAFLMARSKVTPNPPPSPRSPPTKTRRVNPSSSRVPPRDPNIPSSQVVRPASSRPSQSQPNPPHTSAVVRSLPDYKQLYPWASSAFWVRLPPSTPTATSSASRKVTRITSLSAMNMMTRYLCVLVLPKSLFAPITKGATTSPFASSTPRRSRRSNSDSLLPASRGSS